MGPDWPLPISPGFSSTEDYVSELLNFITTSRLHNILCGGIHVLEFFTFEPGLYATVLPQTWRDFFDGHEIMVILDLLMREDLRLVEGDSWRGGPSPPADLVEYIRTVRRLLLLRTFENAEPASLSIEVASGMKKKKLHEVSYFTSYISKLTSDLSENDVPISHIIDLGSGQGYLPRALASAPYSHRVVGVESREHNIVGSLDKDVLANLAPKPLTLRNKKIFRQEYFQAKMDGRGTPTETTSKITKRGERGFFHHPGLPDLSIPADQENVNVSCMPDSEGSVQYVSHYLLDGDLSRITSQILSDDALDTIRKAKQQLSDEEKRRLPRAHASSVNALVISLHSCGNLLHHGLQSLLLTPSVKAVAMVGCCYNLLTERLGPPSYKLDALRSQNERLERQQKAFDPHGFPMSKRLCEYQPAHPPTLPPSFSPALLLQTNQPEVPQRGIRLNITARMMAVQAPQNWGHADSASFYKHHFFRALLQRIFVDLGLVRRPKGGWAQQPSHTQQDPQGQAPTDNDDDDGADADGSGRDEREGGSEAVIVGSVNKRAYESFRTYVRAVAAKLGRQQDDGDEGTMHPTFSRSRAMAFSRALAGMTDEQIEGYEARFAAQKKHLSVVWSLMAFSAGVVEAVVVVDRWLWLREQEEVGEAWVEGLWEYGLSPRNLVVVGVKR